MNKDKENLSIKNNTSKDRKSLNKFHSNLNYKRPIDVKTSENSQSVDKALIKGGKGGLNPGKNLIMTQTTQQRQLEEFKIKRKSVSPCATEKFKKLSSNANTKIEIHSKNSKQDSSKNFNKF